ncbi:MAG: TfoX/Sxy family protein [Proteobacteria bacterium]|nr:TfoX/Sxy family protein [Pseudomonadota bacterium]
MPALPPSPETLQLIAAVQNELAEHLGAHVDVEERQLFGSHAFMVNRKLCLAVKGDELLVRLPPQQHAQTAETPGLRELDPRGGMAGYFWVSPAAYATRAQWQHWIKAALAYNPQAKATPPRARLTPSPPGRGRG